MKKIIIFLVGLSLLSVSCVREVHINDYESRESLRELLTAYDIWYVDIARTQGQGNIPFVSRAFTMSFRPNGEVWANNNIANIGYTGGGYGVKTGEYFVNENSGSISINHIIDGWNDFEVNRISNNEIELYNAYHNVSYVLVGYTLYNFDFDALFYDNIDYFLQDYEYWEKTSEQINYPADFDWENIIKFHFDAYNDFLFSSSQDAPGATDIYWDFTGTYILRPAGGNSPRRLILNYDQGFTEAFYLDVLDDTLIRLTQISTGNTYIFEARYYIQYYRPNQRKKLKKNYLKI